MPKPYNDEKYFAAKDGFTNLLEFVRPGKNASQEKQDAFFNAVEDFLVDNCETVH